MKNTKKVLAAVLVLVGFATTSNAQAVGSTTQATATATIVTPILITKEVDMNFGNIAVTTVGGTVILDPLGARTTTGGVTLPANVGTVTAASFTVTGLEDYTYVITLPTTVQLDNTTTPGTSMDINDLLSSLGASGSEGLLTGGTQTVTLGATLTVDASQEPGEYKSDDFDVTVNYN